VTGWRQESRARWSATAAAWEAGADALARITMPVATWMVEAIRPQPGHTVLELAAGTGDVGFLAAELIRPGGTLICSDFAPEMLSAAQRRARELGLDNVRFRQIDADQPLDLEAASLDGVLCRWGLMLLADPEAALRDIRRVLRPGGRLALAAWAGAEENRWSAELVAVLAERGLLEPAESNQPGQFAWAREGVIAEQLEAAGFVEYEVDRIRFAYRYPSVTEWWEMQSGLSMGLRGAADALTPDERAAVAAELGERAEPWRQADGSLAIPATSWVAAATA
jgi:SAM-dependent methyltransferase